MNTENNRITAEFMGLQYCEKDLIFNSNTTLLTHQSIFSGWISKEINYIKNVPIIVVKQNKKVIPYFRKLEYNSNWNWLLEVVKKIKFIYDESGANKDFRIRLLLFMRTQNTIYDLNIFSTKEEVYNACIEFIKWYNRQEK